MLKPAKIAETLKQVLGLTSEPVGVVLDPGPEWEPLRELKGYRVCQAVWTAAEGERAYLTAKRSACPTGARVLFGKPLAPRVASGESGAKAGIFYSPEAFRTMLEHQPVLEPAPERVGFLPLAEAPEVPDVVVVLGTPTQLMWCARAYVWRTGEPLQCETLTFQAACADAIVRPLKTGRPNASLGCCGSREATGLPETHTSLGLPASTLDEITRNLPLLVPLIEQTRGREVYEFLLERRRKGRA